LKILVVDDEYAFCKSLKEFLTRLGHAVIIATNGEHAIDLMREEKPDFMTLDIRMPGVNGYEILESARNDQNPVKIIVISALDIPMMENSLIQAGAVAVLHKPVNLEDLAKTIGNIAP
jgi:DNA-binding response OmpR family regulator